MSRPVGALLALAFAFSVIAPGCGGGWSYVVQGSDRDRGAEGTISVVPSGANGRSVTVNFNHMTPPDRHGPNLTTFVLWFRDPRGQTQLGAALTYNSSNRTATATATTPYRRFTLLVTVERNDQVISPSENVIFRQQVRTD